LGKSRATIRSGYRSIQIRSHLIFYRVEGNDIRIIRVLH
jgi:plasmid stabilization system protein ParE